MGLSELSGGPIIFYGGRYMRKEQELIWEFRGKLIHLCEQEIYYIHLEDRIIYAHTRTQFYPIGSRISDVEAHLKELPFIRTHYSYLVHMRYMQMLSKDEVVMRNGVHLPVSKNRKKLVHDTVLDYFSDRKNCRKSG